MAGSDSSDDKKVLSRFANIIGRKQRKTKQKAISTQEESWDMSPGDALRVSYANMDTTPRPAHRQSKQSSTASRSQTKAVANQKAKLQTRKRAQKQNDSIPVLNSFSSESEPPLLVPEKSVNAKKSAVNRAQSEQPKKQNPRQSVLVVEPNPKLQVAMKELLEKIGVSPLMASTAKEALNILRQARPAVAIIEAELPDMPGTKLVATIRDRDWGGVIPIVMSAANDEHLHSGDADWLDITDYLYKPFSVHALHTVIKEYIQAPDYKPNVPFNGTVGLVMDNIGQRTIVRRFLVQNGYSIAVSSSAEAIDSCMLYQGAMKIDTWLVQLKDDNLCSKVLDELDDYFDVPVLTGFSPMPNPKTDAAKFAKWQKTILEKLRSTVKVKGFVAA